MMNTPPDDQGTGQAHTSREENGGPDDTRQHADEAPQASPEDSVRDPMATLAESNALLRKEIRRHRRTQEELEGLFNLSMDMFCIAGFDGFFKRLNPAFQNFLGIADDDLSRVPLADFTPPDDLAATLAELDNLSTSAPTIRFENRYRRRDGVYRWFEWMARPVPEKGLIYASARDITERKRAEEAIARKAEALERSNAELQQFAYVASHDLQEPLRTISSYVQLLHKRYQGQLDEDADDFIDFIVNAAERMQALIHDLLAYSRVGRREIQRLPVDATMVLERTLAGIETTLSAAGAEVTYDPLPTIKADPIQLSLLFQNLVSNGIKFHGKAAPRVHVSAERDGHSWRFAVRDNGIGIKAVYQDRIFEVFRRLHSRSQYAGTGIGLAICKKIIERHGGRIWVESEVDKGATFFFTIPI